MVVVIWSNEDAAKCLLKWRKGELYGCWYFVKWECCLWWCELVKCIGTNFVPCVILRYTCWWSRAQIPLALFSLYFTHSILYSISHILDVSTTYKGKFILIYVCLLVKSIEHKYHLLYSPFISLILSLQWETLTLFSIPHAIFLIYPLVTLSNLVLCLFIKQACRWSKAQILSMLRKLI